MMEMDISFDPADEAIKKRLRAIVERIMARCRQFGATIGSMMGTHLVPANEKYSGKFCDIHANANQSDDHK